MMTAQRINRIFLLTPAIGLVLIAGAAAVGPSPAASQSNPHGPAYQSILGKYVRQGLPGAALLVRTREEGTWIGAAGYARIEDRAPMRTDSVFFTLSNAKSYTAAAILMLRDQGLIDLDAKIDVYLARNISDRIANGHTATVRHLLSHTSGIPEGQDDFVEPWNDPYGMTWRDFLEAAYDEPALFAPGAGREYTNINYLLLALIIDGRIGHHAQFFSTRIFQPLAMFHTYYKLEPGLPRPPQLANVYFDRYGDGAVENGTDVLSVLSYNSDIGFAGIFSDLSGCARFMEALAGGELVGRDSWAEMIKPSYPGFEWHGLGIGIIPWRDGQGISRTFYEMAGSGMEGLAQTRTSPEAGITVSCATNIGTRNRPLSRELFMKIFDEATDYVMKRRGEGNGDEAGERDLRGKPGKK